jgi:alpha-D-xyloside xylohydrolase
MPYIYRTAANSRDTGIPFIRPMILEFPHDPAVPYLDRQYMFGNSILVAPIFNDRGHADFYLPEGTWTHLLSGETREGGKWHAADYDYFSLPLFVNQNTLLPLGGRDDKPDYDYTDAAEFHLFALADGASAVSEVTDLAGTVILTVTVKRSNGTLAVHCIGKHRNCSLVLHVSGKTKRVPLEGDAVTAEYTA